VRAGAPTDRCADAPRLKATVIDIVPIKSRQMRIAVLQWPPNMRETSS
jgi:hypothetical protein